MIDLSIKWGLLAAAAWWLTRRRTHVEAAAAHRLWLAVLLAPFGLIAANAMFPPALLLVPRVELSVTSGSGAWTLRVYLAIASLMALRIAWGLVCVRRLIRGATVLEGDALRQLPAAALQPGLDVREGDVRVPVTAGFARPCIILPRGWQALTPDTLTAILHHEAAHVRRRDGALALLAAIVPALFWFHPAAWLAAARLRFFAEMACDAQAAASMPRGAYISELLALSASWAGVRAPRYAVTASAGSELAWRIRLLIDGMSGEGRRSILLPVALVVILLSVPLSAMFRFSVSRVVASAVLPHGFGHDHLPHAGFGVRH